MDGKTKAGIVPGFKDRARNTLLSGLLATTLLTSPSLLGEAAHAQQPSLRPNIVVIWGDDIGSWNLSAYSRGAMGYRTHNIDRIGKEGAQVRKVSVNDNDLALDATDKFKPVNMFTFVAATEATLGVP